MNPSNDEFPKKSPFVLRESSDHPAGHTGMHPTQRLRVNGRPIHPSNKGMMSVAVFLISSLSMGIGLAGGAWLGFDVLQDGADDLGSLFAGLVAAGLAYGVGGSSDCSAFEC